MHVDVQNQIPKAEGIVRSAPNQAGQAVASGAVPVRYFELPTTMGTPNTGIKTERREHTYTGTHIHVPAHFYAAGRSYLIVRPTDRRCAQNRVFLVFGTGISAGRGGKRKPLVQSEPCGACVSRFGEQVGEQRISTEREIKLCHAHGLFNVIAKRACTRRRWQVVGGSPK